MRRFSTEAEQVSFQNYPPLKGRIDVGDPASGEEPAVMDLLSRIEVVGHRDRPAIAPRITVCLRDGKTVQDEFRGNELEWGLATEVRRLSALFDGMPWPRDRLDSIVQRVTHLEEEAQVDPLIQLCMRR